MGRILDELFQLDLCFTSDREFEERYAAAAERAAQTEQRLKEQLPPEYRQLLDEYLQNDQTYQYLGAQYEFERGFIMAGKILLEVLLGQSEASMKGPLKDRDRSENEG